ncbi:Phosphoesterase [plant metagenome]|uniref:Phosphoesterase n=1 Tax=plant metagenome TaxID=1297885 RepID=A0A484SFL6_9ZZZZ
MFHIALLFCFIYVFWRFVIPLPWRFAYKLVLAGVLLLVSKYHLIQLLVFGTMFSPEMPRVLVILCGWLFCAFVLLLLIHITFDLLLAATWVVRRGRPLGARFQVYSRYGMACLALALSAIGVNQAVQVPEVRRMELGIRNLPPAFDGFRIVQLSDPQLSRLLEAPWAEDLVARTNSLQADLIVITGDLIDGTPQARHNDVQPLSKLSARHGVIASLGNHEYFFDARVWTAEFQRLGMRVLVNQHELVDEQGQSLIVAGIADPVATAFNHEAPDLTKALAGAPAGLPIVLLSHQPIDVLQHAAAGVDLQLSGHTHGGMVRGLDWFIGRFNGGYVSGLYVIETMLLYVNNGAGLWNGFPIRLGVPSEITEIVLRPAAA